MISRRLVRVKTLQTLYAWKQSQPAQDADFVNELTNSLNHSHSFYLFLLDFPYQLHQYLNEKLQLEQAKFYPDQEKIRQFGLFANTPLVQKLHQEVLLNGDTNGFVWTELRNRFEEWFDQMMAWDFVKDYLIFDQPSIIQQKEFLEQFFYAFVESHEALNSSLEDIYPSWPDDSSVVVREIYKSLAPGKESPLTAVSPAIDKHNEDLVFGLDLLKYTMRNSEKYDQMVTMVTENWDPSRIAIIDLLIIKLTLTEFLNFDQIPVKVTMNEYLEITKNYSTPNSSKFVNGILDKLRIELEKKGMIQKSGRGLREK